MLFALPNYWLTIYRLLPNQLYRLGAVHLGLLAVAVGCSYYLPASLHWYLFIGTYLSIIVFSYIRAPTAVFAVLIGLGIGLLQAMQWHHKQLTDAQQNTEQTLQGSIVSLVEAGPNRLRFRLKDNRNRLWIVSQYFAQNAPKPELSYGDCIQFDARVRRARGFKNPYIFDYETYLNGVGIIGTALVKTTVTPSLGCHQNWFDSLGQLRQSIAEKIANLNLTEQNKALISAIVIADTRNIDQSTWSLFQQTGLIHLLVISGLHIGIIASLFFLLGRALERVIQLKFYIKPNVIASIIALTFTLCYVALSQFGTSATRAGIMIFLFIVLRILWHKATLSFVFMATLALSLTMQPRVFLLTGFWLSFGAVAILMLYFATRSWQGQGAVKKYVVSLLLAQVALTVGMTFLFAKEIGYINLLTPLTNLIYVPIFCLVVIPLILFNSLLLALGINAFYLWQFVDLVLNHAIILLEQIHAQQVIWHFTYQPSWLLLICGVAVFVLLQPYFLPLRVLSLLPIIALFLPNFELTKDQTHLSFLDVGQGSAVVLISTKDGDKKTLVYDTGPAFSDNFNSGRDIIAPYLRRLGVRQIDYLFVSHSDSDHSGGVAPLIEAIAVKQVIASQPIGDIASSHCNKYDRYQMHNIEIAVLHPQHNQLFSNNNDYSCVLKITFDGNKIVLLGDISKKIEAQLVDTNIANTTILAAAHHGSNTSSSRQLISQTQPQYVIFSSGYLNRFNHPHPMVVQRFQDHSPNSVLLNTATKGAIEFFWKQGQMTIKTQR